MEFKIGDKVKLVTPEPFRSNSDFIVVTMNSDGTALTIYSKKWSENHHGHSGNTRGVGKLMDDDWGHWSVRSEEIVHRDKPVKLFSIGDEVEYRSEKFVIVGKHSENTWVLFSPDWVKEERGHQGTTLTYAGNGGKYGHYFVNEVSLKLINKIKNEVFRSNSEGCPGGIESKIYSQSVKIASASRPVGSRTTACRIGITVRSGVVNNNKLQPH